MHPDHAGGLMSEGKLAFPNAVLRASQREADFWLNQGNFDKSPAAMKDFFKGAMASVNPYIVVGKPSVTIRFDVDSQRAALQRQQAYADAVKAGYLIGTAHLSFPGGGHICA